MELHVTKNKKSHRGGSLNLAVVPHPMPQGKITIIIILIAQDMSPHNVNWKLRARVCLAKQNWTSLGQVAYEKTIQERKIWSRPDLEMAV